MNRRVYFYFLATILLGAVLGGTGTYYYLWHTGRVHHDTGFNKARAIDHLKKVLGLTDAQVQQLGQIFDEAAQKTGELQKQIEPQFQALHMETRGRIRQILNPDQQKIFDEHVRQIDERRKRHPQPLPPLPSR
jgi:Spy/CpxP family protein refolding chaperone